MSTLTLLDEIDDLERLLAGAAAPIATSSLPSRLAVADDDEEADFGEDDLGFDDIDESDADEDDDEDGDEDDVDEDDDE
jgi:hypothetical protein